MPIEAIHEINLVKRLGAGFFGEVHEAELRPFGRVAVKIIPCAKLAGYLNIPPSDWPAIRDALFAEADSLNKGSHDNVVRVHGAHYDVAKDNGYIVVELCDGSVDASIKAGPLPLGLARTYLGHALQGLEALHRRAMVHRDLKPPNLLLKGETCKLSDFGLVSDRMVAGYASEAGYLEHRAPEIFTTNLTSFRTDVWAMGLTAYQMISGEPWYLEVLRGLGADKRVDPNGARCRIRTLVTGGGFAKKLPFLPHVPDEWRRFVRKALHDDPHQRFASASAMLNAMSTRKLPSSPSFTCQQSLAEITWRRPKAGGEVVVQWMRPAGALDSVLIESRTGTRTRTLRRLLGVSRADALDALQTFFARST